MIALWPLRTATWACLMLALASSLVAAERPEVVVADFEGETYGQWQVTGDAFGTGPAKGTLPGQMPVAGFEGTRLVNSFVGGDRSTGTLTSPAFRIERRFLNFLIGGGQHRGETCIDLLLDGKVVHSATGPNDRPGGSERLDWATWDVSALAGKEVVLRIVDQHQGGWGHINVDQIVQSDRRLQAEPAAIDLVANGRYLLLPVRTGATVRRFQLQSDGAVLREWEMEFAEDAPEFHAFLDLQPFRGKKLRLTVDRLAVDSQALQQVKVAEELPPSAGNYSEPKRPGFHFTSRVGWLNDPNGLVFQGGEWHLFYQHNPYGWNWGNMHWGHAVSSDLVTWRELAIALYPPRLGDWCFSGSAVVDRANTSGWQMGAEPPLVAAFTSTGRGECIVYSGDRGRTWTEFPGNPVVKHEGRDPRLLWHAPTKSWCMAVYDEHAGERWIAFYSSPDLKQWTYRSRIAGFFECPDLFELGVAGTEEKRWVLYAADGKYVLGDFDGGTFHPTTDKLQLWYGNFYAAQTFSDAPDGRRIQIGWGNGITFPKSPFNQQMTIASELTLRPTPLGPRLHAEPVRELAALRGESVKVPAGRLPRESYLDGSVPGELLDAEFELAVSDDAQCVMELRGLVIQYDAAKRELSCGGKTASLAASSGRLSLRVLVDRGSVEIFANGGEVAMSLAASPAMEARQWRLQAGAGDAEVVSGVIYSMKSIW